MSDTTETTGQPGPFGFAKMAGSSIAGRHAAPWVTDFLNAAYYRRTVDDRDVDDLRFAFGVLTTYWYGDGEPPALPEGAEPLVGFDLTTHRGHFMGSGHNRLMLYTDEGRAWVKAAGTWDPMPWHLDKAYEKAGREAQHAFWGQEGTSMLLQLAQAIA